MSPHPPSRRRPGWSSDDLEESRVIASKPAPKKSAAYDTPIETAADVGAGLAADPIEDRIDPAALKALVEKSLDDDKAQAVTVIDLAGKSTIADHMVIASGTSRRQVSAMADHLMERIKAAGALSPVIDGEEQGDWVLIDAGDVIVHLFRPEVREFYNLEKMWGADMPELTPGRSAAAEEPVTV